MPVNEFLTQNERSQQGRSEPRDPNSIHRAPTFSFSTVTATLPQEKWKNEYQKADQELQRTRDELKRVKSESSVFKKNCQELERDRRRHEENAAALRKELLDVQQGHEDLITVKDSWSRLMEELLSEAGLSPVLNTIDNVHLLNEEIDKVSTLLSENLTHTSHELFQEEISRSYGGCKIMIGEELSNLLISRSQPQQGNTLDALLTKAVSQIFMISFCASEIRTCSVSGAHLAGRESMPLTGGGSDLHETRPLLERDRKSKLLQELTNVFKVASWAIPGSTKRAAFEESLTPLFKALDDLNATGNILDSEKIVLSVACPNHSFMHDFMESTFAGRPAQPVSRSAQEFVAGTIAFGLKKKKDDEAQGGAPRFRNLLPAKVILYSTFQNKFKIPLSPPDAILKVPDNRTASQTEDGHDSVAEEAL
ncbi:hypothetical protein BDZ97DRAFT_1923065 [Flammula alnicola]|nr:hypothetical protein BDZ97DRAFT_1923065 [Flammula alnicola]